MNFSDLDFNMVDFNFKVLSAFQYLFFYADSYKNWILLLSPPVCLSTNRHADSNEVCTLISLLTASTQFHKSLNAATHFPSFLAHMQVWNTDSIIYWIFTAEIYDVWHLSHVEKLIEFDKNWVHLIEFWIHSFI